MITATLMALFSLVGSAQAQQAGSTVLDFKDGFVGMDEAHLAHEITGLEIDSRLAEKTKDSKNGPLGGLWSRVNDGMDGAGKKKRFCSAEAKAGAQASLTSLEGLLNQMTEVGRSTLEPTVSNLKTKLKEADKNLCDGLLAYFADEEEVFHRSLDLKVSLSGIEALMRNLNYMLRDAKQVQASRYVGSVQPAVDADVSRKNDSSANAAVAPVVRRKSAKKAH